MKKNHQFLITAAAGILAASVPANAQQSVAVAAFYATNGALDTSFGKNGKAVFPVFGTVTSAALDSKGRIVVVSTALGPQFRLARIQSNGIALDTSFGVNGYVLTNIPGGASGNAVTITAQDGIAVAGETNGKLNVQVFDQNGNQSPWLICQATAPANWSGEAFGIAIDASGRIVVAGTRTVGAQAYRQFLVARFLPTGCPDPSFAGGAAIASTDTSGSGGSNVLPTWQEGKAVAIDGQGRILVAGPGWYSGDEMFFTTWSCTTVARYLNNGLLDTSFGGVGTGVACAHLGYNDSPSAVTQAANAMALAGSDIWVAGSYAGIPTLARFDSSGHNTLLTGTAIPPHALIPAPSVNALTVGGSINEFSLAEVDLNGYLMPGFGNNGVEYLDANCAMSSSIAALMNQLDGGKFGYWRIIAAGPSGPNACP